MVLSQYRNLDKKINILDKFSKCIVEVSINGLEVVTFGKQ